MILTHFNLKSVSVRRDFGFPKHSYTVVFEKSKNSQSIRMFTKFKFNPAHKKSVLYLEKQES